jgi:hypothetical protein
MPKSKASGSENQLSRLALLAELSLRMNWIRNPKATGAAGAS